MTTNATGLRGLPFEITEVLQGIAEETKFRGLAQRLFTILIFGTLYGAAMGMFGGLHGDRVLQVIYSAAKVPLLILVTFFLSLPSFFVLNTLFGLRGDFPIVFRALIQTQTGLTIVLASLAPLTLTWYVSFTDYPTAVLVNGFQFGVASLAAQIILRRCYRPLIAKRPRHRYLLGAWLILYAFLGIQMGWLLRPFIGDPSRAPQFLRADVWRENAYEVLLRSVLRLFEVTY